LIGPVLELFVYYRARVADAAPVQVAVEAMQARLRARHPALIARLLRRPEPQDECHTWMEAYATDPARAPAGIDASLQAAIDSAAAAELQPLLVGPRHTEVFRACA
jgi:Domain of unknown function (DUF4936)